MKEVHGHDLINLIATQERVLSLSEVKELALKEIGTDVVYHTCSSTGMSTDEMVTFLLDKGKLVEKGSGYQIDFVNVCDH